MAKKKKEEPRDLKVVVLDSESYNADELAAFWIQDVKRWKTADDALRWCHLNGWTLRTMATNAKARVTREVMRQAKRLQEEGLDLKAEDVRETLERATEHAHLGERLRVARETATKLSKSEAGRGFGAEHKALHQYERGKVEPKAGRIKQLARLYGVTPSVLIGFGPRNYTEAFKEFMKRFGPEEHLTPSELDWLAATPIPEGDTNPIKRYIGHYSEMRSGATKGFSPLEVEEDTG